jgi:hypothetical protein
MAEEVNDLSRFRKATYLLCLDAKFMAYEGQMDTALQQLADVYKMGTFFTGPRFLVEQLVGIAISGLAVNSAFQILDHTNPSPVILEDFQKRITSLSSNQPFLINLSSERLIFDDEVQRRFVGRDHTNFFEDPLHLKKLWLGTVWAAKENRRADRMYDYLGTAAHKIPWELHSEGNDVSNVIKEMTKGTVLLRIIAPNFSKVLQISYRVQVHTDALIAATAILRFKVETGQYPQDLQQLVTAGYLEKLPMDAFSGSALAYRVTGDNFELYSFAGDFDDDGGKHDPDWAAKGDGDFVFWPVQSKQSPEKTKKGNND